MPLTPQRLFPSRPPFLLLLFLIRLKRSKNSRGSLRASLSPKSALKTSSRGSYASSAKGPTARSLSPSATPFRITTQTTSLSPPYKPVEKHILFSMAHSFTDFHIDLGGSSVFYHLVKGRKTFYCIEPTDSNLALFEGWLGEDSVAAPNFFGDKAEGCFEVNLLEGQLLFIPSGWIHAVWTPCGSRGGCGLLL